MHSGYRIPYDPNVHNAFKPPRTVFNLHSIQTPVSDFEEDLEDSVRDYTTKELKHNDSVHILPMAEDNKMYSVGEIPLAFLFTINEGDDEDERIGNKICIHSIHLKGYVECNWPAGAIYANIIVLYVILDTQGGGTEDMHEIFSLEDIPAITFIDADETKRFKVISKLCFEFNQRGTDGVTPFQMIKHFEIFEPVNFNVSFNQEEPLVYNDILKNNVILCWGALHATVAEAPKIYMSSRVSYTDCQ